MILEACVETLNQALRAQKLGAHRLELCSKLSQDGLTPSYDLVTQVQEAVEIPIMVMVRPRSGDFSYSQSEYEQMIQDVTHFSEVGVAGIVFGILDDQNKIDLMRVQQLTELAKPLEVTFHKAIDSTENPIVELKKLMEISGINRILTSGKGETAWDGRGLLANMVNTVGSRIKIIAAGKITNQNLQEIASVVATSEFHGTKIVGNLDLEL